MKKQSLKQTIELLILIILCVFLFYTVSGYYILPVVGKNYAIKKINELLGRQAYIEKIEFDPFTFELTVNDLKINEKDGSSTWIDLKHTYVDFDSKSITNGALVIKEIKFYIPYINITRNENNAYNFSDIKIETKSDKRFLFSINNIQITNARIDFNDLPENTKHKIEGINITFPFLSNLPKLVDTFTKPSISAKINGSPFNLAGQTKPFAQTLETTFDVNLSDIDLSYYLKYLPFDTNFNVTDGIFNSNLILSFANLPEEKSYLNVEGNVTMQNTTIKLKQDNLEFLKLPSISVSIPQNNLLKNELLIKELKIEKPETNIVRLENGSFYLPAIYNQQQPSPKEETKNLPKNKEEKPFVLNIEKIDLNEGKVNLKDLSAKEPFKKVLYPVNLKVDNFNTKPGNISDVLLNLSGDTNEKFQLAGKLSLNPINLNVSSFVKNIRLNEFKPYYAQYLTKEIHDGIIDANATIYYSNQKNDTSLKINGLNASLNNLKIYDNSTGTGDVEIKQINVNNLDIFPFNKTINLEKVTISNSHINAIYDNNGTISLSNIIKLKTEQKPETNATRQDEAKWNYKINNAEINDLSIELDDNFFADNSKINARIINANIKNITNEKDKQLLIEVQADLFEKGKLKTSGTLTVLPLDGNFTVGLKDMPLKVFQPYIGKFVNVILVKGEGGLEGKIKFNKKNESPISFTISGSAEFDNFKILDGFKAEDLLSFKSLLSNNIQVKSNPFQVSVDEIIAEKFKSQLFVEEDGTTNIHTLLNGSSKNNKDKKAQKSVKVYKDDKKDKTAEQEKQDIIIKKISFTNSNFFFLDQRVNPPFKLALSELNGDISGLATISEKPARINFAGKADGYSPVRISGDLSSNPENLYADMSIKINTLEMTSLSPYSGKYLGYTISKGKLDLDTQYKVHKNILNIESKILFDQLDFGEEVESPDAVSLPLRLAISLLKNRKGEINISMPVTGDMKDPEFTVGGLVLKMIVNLVKKIITSPFSFVGSLFGGGEEINIITFESGSFTPDDESIKKLEILAKALYDRPGIKVDVIGYVEKKSDEAGILENKFLRILKAQKFKDIVGSLKDDVEIDFDKMSIASDEYEKYLWEAYKSAPFEKPKLLMTVTKKIPKEEQEAALKNHIKIYDSDFRNLSEKRINLVRDYLIETGRVEPERVFLLSPIIKEVFEDKEKNNRKVELKIK